MHSVNNRVSPPILRYKQQAQVKVSQDKSSGGAFWASFLADLGIGCDFEVRHCPTNCGLRPNMIGKPMYACRWLGFVVVSAKEQLRETAASRLGQSVRDSK